VPWRLPSSSLSDDSYVVQWRCNNNNSNNDNKRRRSVEVLKKKE